MDRFEIHGQSTTSSILVGESLRNLARYLPPASKCIIISDSNVSRRYRRLFADHRLIEVAAGESGKTLAAVEKIYAGLLAHEADRSTFLVGVGGGVVCDLTGFAAATYLRGLEFGFVATSLLAQVDASTGGKNAVNFRGYKNLIGTIRQPRFVICDPQLLETLPRREIHNGMAEVLKHALIGDPALFSFLERHARAQRSYQRDFFRRVVRDSIAVKAAIVSRDELETGERRVLNFGHTLGHAIEKTTQMPHGAAIRHGMAFAVRYSLRDKKLAAPAAERILALLDPASGTRATRFEKRKVLAAMRKDKKREADRIHFVFLRDIGVPEIEAISFDALDRAVHDLC